MQDALAQSRYHRAEDGTSQDISLHEARHRSAFPVRNNCRLEMPHSMVSVVHRPADGDQGSSEERASSQPRRSGASVLALKQMELASQVERKEHCNPEARVRLPTTAGDGEVYPVQRKRLLSSGQHHSCRFEMCMGLTATMSRGKALEPIF